MKIPANASKVVLITGAASGIGRRTAERFLALGDQVHICDSSDTAVDEFLAVNPGASASVADVSDPTAVDRVFEEIGRQFDRIDVLINNAGVAGPTAAVEDCADDEWDRCIRVNLSGTFYVTKRAVPLLRRSRSGCIINVASTAALFGYPLRSPYAASKWAQIGLTKTWAMELGPAGIRVNAVCPTSVSGPRIDGVIAREAGQRGLSSDEVRKVYERQTSMRSFVSTDDVADTILFLASEQAGKISGQSLSVDGHTEGLSNWLD
jgi:NAD(P)-dependent dehydrogenase (short-subunit alcohol dehydrogenase family)